MIKYKCPACRNELIFTSYTQKDPVFCKYCKRDAWIKEYYCSNGIKCRIVFNNPFIEGEKQSRRTKSKKNENQKVEFSWLKTRIMIADTMYQYKKLKE